MHCDAPKSVPDPFPSVNPSANQDFKAAADGHIVGVNATASVKEKVNYCLKFDFVEFGKKIEKFSVKKETLSPQKNISTFCN